jgi:PAS domain S-box-containing protein
MARAASSLGLEHFDRPRYLALEPEDLAQGAADRLKASVGIYALLGRAVVAIGLVVAGPALAADADRASAFAWAVALGWLPVAGVLDLARRRRADLPIGGLKLLWDLALWVGVHAVLEAPGAAGAGFLLTVAYHAYVGSRVRAMAAGGLAILAMVAVPAVTDAPLEGFVVGSHALATVLLVWLLVEVSGRQATARAGLLQVTDRNAAILAGIADAVVVTSPHGRVRQWNRAAERVFGQPAEEVQDQPCSEVLGLRAGLRPLACAEGCALLQDGEPRDVELWRAGGDGRRQPLLASAAPVLDQDGTVVEVIHSFRDITSVKAAEEAKTLFLATASHELKTPLTVIRGSAQLLRGPSLADDSRAALIDAIESRSMQLAGIIDRLLMSSRIDAGRVELDLSPLALGPVLAERCAELSAAVGRPVRWESGALPEALAEQDALVTVVDHLLDNAVKYSPDGSAVTVTARETEQHVMLAVADTGIGMTPEQAQRCFDRFWQAESTDGRRFGGTGIGLYIVRSLVEAMGGTIEVASDPGVGTTFTIGLRRADVEIDLGAAPEADDAPAAQHSMIREYMRQVGVPLQAGGS